MEPCWHYSLDGRTRLGPVTLEELRQLAGRGELGGESLVWRSEWSQWRHAKTIEELFVATGDAEALEAAAATMEPSLSLWEHAKRHFRRALASDLQTVDVLPGEAAELAARGIESPLTQKYVAWRFSNLLVVLAPTALSVVFGVDRIRGMFDSLSPLGKLAYAFQALALVALPAAVAAAARWWMRPRLSRLLLLYGWGAAFLVPTLISLAPGSWVLSSGAMADKLRLGWLEFVNFLPIVLSLIPGVVRGCLRVKTLLPQSIVPGWFLMAAAFSYALMLLPAFILISKYSGSLLLVLAIAAWLAAPLAYLAHGRIFVSPQETDSGKQAVRKAQFTSIGLAVAAVALSVAFAFSHQLDQRTILGLSDSGSLLRPWDWHIIKFLIEYTGRTLFVTVLAVDVFMLINVSVWTNARQFFLSPKAEEYDQVIRGLDSLLGASQPLLAPREDWAGAWRHDFPSKE